ncbi:uncharacterized protein LOC133307585 [Gastrolobium bilobum]|uniref:uncharacterized protein LOC133307585 n=1 Tax=Gastrolobium bilobum TaxID=150636 RepID=UPI002AB25DED|nr:uncharacterized protein LOC133307585 [Gastrolobium bilobum]
MKKRLQSLWAKDGEIYVTDIENNFFLVRFKKKKDLDFVKTAGPWIIMDHYLAIRSWEPDFQPLQASIDRIVAWIRLPGFPTEYVNSELVETVGNWLGKYIKVDTATTLLARGQFARICVELDLSKPLQAEYLLDGRNKRVEYEGLHLVCFACGKYGHSSEYCPSKRVLDQAVPPPNMNMEMEVQQTEREVVSKSHERGSKGLTLLLPSVVVQQIQSLLPPHPHDGSDTKRWFF